LAALALASAAAAPYQIARQARIARAAGEPMSDMLSSDYQVDRRQMRRKITFWRAAAFIVAIAAVVALGMRGLDASGASPLGPHIARLSIEGLITGDKDTLKLVRDIGESKAAAVLVSIESPGGTTTGAERLYGELRRIAEKKPVVAVVGTMAASGGYIAAMSADRIMARGNSLVGSIGVLFQYPNFASLLDKVGVKMEAVKSSPLKAAPSGYEPTSPEARAALNALVVDSYDWFKDMVKERRGMSDAELAAVTDGRVFTGRQGLPLKLVDAIGGEREAIEWLEKEKGVAKKLPVRDWKKGRSIERLGLLGASGEIARFLGLNGLADALQRGATAQEAQLLDGLLAIWQVEAAQ
jgi:protease-4